MSVCYFNNNFDVKYTCRYEFDGKRIEIVVDHDIMDEVEAVGGVKSFGVNTEFKTKDIFIIDHQTKQNYLVKDAWFSKANRVWGTPDGGAQTKYQSDVYFQHRNMHILSELSDESEIRKIKIYSKSITDWIGMHSVNMVVGDETTNITLFENHDGEKLVLKKNGIKQIIVNDSASCVHDYKGHNIKIDISGYIELELSRQIPYSKVPDYVNEILVFMQLYCHNKFLIDKIYVQINGTYFILNTPIFDLQYTPKYVEFAVADDILTFLRNCYEKIPYRNSKSEIRNIPYIVLNTSRSIEDNFLMFYRFIECYYKKTKPELSKRFIIDGISRYYFASNNWSQEQIEEYTQEIISLRNHYVHSGYYIHNSKLRIKYPGNKNPKTHYAHNVDVNWIYERTKILYEICVDIIFKEMLGYNTYKYKKNF